MPKGQYIRYEKRFKGPYIRYKKIDLAYVAGIVDGEGSISITSSDRKRSNGIIDKYYFLSVTVSNTNKPILIWLQSLFGGSLYDKRNYYENCKPVHIWRCASNIALRFLKRIYPYLRIKKLHAEIAMQFCKVMNKSGYMYYKENVGLCIDEVKFSEISKQRADFKRQLGILNKRGLNV